MKNKAENVVTEDVVATKDAHVIETKAKTPANKADVDKIIRKSVYASMGLGIVPFRLFNLASVTGNNLLMVKKLAALHNIPFKEETAKSIIASVLGTGAGTVTGPMVAPLAAGIPIIGLPLFIAAGPALNGMTTYALGHMFVNYFEQEGGFVHVNTEALKASFKGFYSKSREALGDLIKGGKKPAEAAEA